jgi:hypothetical protein
MLLQFCFRSAWNLKESENPKNKALPETDSLIKLGFQDGSDNKVHYFDFLKFPFPIVILIALGFVVTN